MKIREITTKQAITLDIVSQRLDKPWYQYRDTFPTYSDQFLAIAQMCSALSALILAIAYFIIIFQDSITFHTFVFFLFVTFVCVMIIGSSLKINFF